MNLMQKPARSTRQSGFTLIEIMIVIGIIALIAGIVANSVLGSGDKAKYSLAKSQIQTLAAKIENYELDNGQPPAQLQDLVQQPANSSDWMGPYAKESELKDPWKRPFEYRMPGQNGKYDLISYGADGRPGGEKFDRDISNAD